MIITRSEAKQRGLNKFFTGKECRNGHIAERYTQSGTCQDCIRQHSGGSPTAEQSELARMRAETARMKAETAADRLKFSLQTQQESAQRRQEREQQAAARQTMIRTYRTCPDRSVTALRDYAFMLAITRNPAIRFTDVALPSVSPTRVTGTIGRYLIACYPEDSNEIMLFANSLMAPVSVTPQQAQAARTERLQKITAAAENSENWLLTNN